MKTLSAVLAALLSLSAAVCAQGAPVLQQAPAYRMSLSGPTIVAANAEVSLRLVVDVVQDTTVPAAVVNGTDLTVRVGGEAAAPISRPGQGGDVKMVAGSRLERRLSFPVSTVLADVEVREMVVVAVGWKDQVGVDCTFKVAPDSSNVKLEDLDLEKTQVILVTNYGEMQLGFRPDKAPRHVENFLKLCLQGFYADTKFHRVIRNFMIQGGCPNTKDDSKRALWGRGNPGYKIDDELNDLRHLKGTLSMAHSGPNTGGSQFFIMHSEAPHLNGVHTAFGNVVAGIDVLDAIASVQVGGPQKSTPVQPVVLSAAVVLPVTKK
ncbi:MAG: peptidylprolyl isomerase [Planctomycetota bacterium]